MKKDLIFAPMMLLLGAALFLLRATGMTAHIVISVIGIAILIAYAVLTKKDWKIPALEIIMRVFCHRHRDHECSRRCRPFRDSQSKCCFVRGAADHFACP